MKTKRCRHGRSWLIAGGRWEWCYMCGALREMRLIEGTNGVAPAGRWIRPVGANGQNPWRLVEPRCE